MKTMWQIVSFLAVVHMLAMGMFAGWLATTGRLDLERLEAIRELLRETSDERAAKAEAEAEADLQAEMDAEEAMRQADPPDSSAQQVRHFARVEDREQQALRRMQTERDLLLGQLAAMQSDVAARELALADDRAEWEAMIEDEKQRRIDEQFQKAVKQLEMIPPKQAKAILENMMRDDGVRAAVVYFDAMQPRAAAKVLREFKTDVESVLATQLLEALRDFGTMAGASEDSGNEHRIAAAE